MNCLSCLATASLETTATIITKNCFCFMVLDNVRESLQKTITEVVKPSFGGFIGPLVGSQIGTMCSIPVTFMLGDLLVTSLKELVSSIKSLYRAVIYGEKNESTTPFLRDLIINVTSFAVGFFAKTYFCNYCMSPVGTVLKLAIALGAPLLGASLAVSLMAPAMIMVTAPSVTFVISDIVGTIASNVTFFILDGTSRLLFDG